MARLSVAEYLAGEETNRPQELAYGILREPAAPTFQHQVIAGRVYRRLSQHVERYLLGVVAMSPVDVILDRERALIVQPDILFVSAERQAICQERVWGAPDLVVEILSTGNSRRDRTTKRGWYERYGVRECWFVDTLSGQVEVRGLAAGQTAASHTYEDRSIVRSSVLPRLRLRAGDVFGRSRRSG